MSSIVNKNIEKIKLLIESACIRVNYKFETFASRKICKGDLIDGSLALLDKAQQNSKPRYLFEDKDLQVIDKPVHVTVEVLAKGFSFPDYDMIYRLNK